MAGEDAYSEDHRIPFTPANTAKEIGIMIAFISAFVFVTLAYLTTWKRGNAREELKEIKRKEALREKQRVLHGASSKGDVFQNTTPVGQTGQDGWDRDSKRLPLDGDGMRSQGSFVVGE